MKQLHVLLAVLLLSLFVGLVEARGGTFVINPGGEVVEKLQLSPPDSVFGNLSVSGGFVEFFVANPSNNVIYRNAKTSLDSFNFTADESGTFEMHFVNEYQIENVVLNLSYSVNMFIFVSEVIHISASTTTVQITTSDGIIVTRLQPNPNITVSINPPGFPVVGQFWEISVFSQNQGSDGTTYLSPLPNATVLIRVATTDQPMVYNATVNEEGRLQFQFLSKYSDVSFQAISGGDQSDIIAFTRQARHYVSAGSVDSVSALSGIMLGITALSVVGLHFGKKTRVVFIGLIGAVLCLALVLLVISAAVKFYWLTPWGYTENIFGFLTWTLMFYAAIGGIVLYAILFLAALYLGPRSRKDEVPLE